MNQLARFTALAVAIGVVGCSSGDKPPAYANVSGTVNYNGKPIDKGQISFATDGRMPMTLDIVDGKYNGQAMIGSNRVSVSAFRKAAKQRYLPPGAQAQVKAYQAMNKGGGGTADTPDPSMEDYIPEDWGVASKQSRVVEAGGANKFDIDIKGK